MKKRLLSFLACPTCKNDLRLKVSREHKGEIIAGTLFCSQCETEFPVRKGIPRFAQSDAYTDTFGFEWNRFYDVQIDILNGTDESEKTFNGKTGWIRPDLEGKLILDVGVGAGRFAEVVSRWGAEVVGVDLSCAVDAAQDRVGVRENVHIIQADLFNLPFREVTFDAMYSMGVLHHTPDTNKAFDSVIRFLKPEGEFAVFVYAYGHYAYCSDIWRRITTKLPYRIVYGLSALSIPLYYVYKLPVLGLALRFLFPMSQHPNPRWRWLDTFDWYSPKYQHKHTWPEVYDWFTNGGLVDIKLFQETKEFSVLHVNMRGRKT